MRAEFRLVSALWIGTVASRRTVGGDALRAKYARAHEVESGEEQRRFLTFLRAEGVTEIASAIANGRADVVWNDPPGGRIDPSDFASFVPFQPQQEPTP
jgi:hypothetical protein